jgi:hypothetical protein
MHDVSDGGYAFGVGNTPALTMHQWELLVGKSHASKLPIPAKGNEVTGNEDW